LRFAFPDGFGDFAFGPINEALDGGDVIAEDDETGDHENPAWHDRED
jgi:hypothetical protein